MYQSLSGVVNRLNSVQKECHAVKVKFNQLRDKIAAASEVAGITLNEGAHEDITVCMLYYMCSGKINKTFITGNSK